MEKSIYAASGAAIARKREELAPRSLAAFKAFSDSVFADGALPAKRRQQIAVAVVHITQCPDCIPARTSAAVKSGTTEPEIMEAMWGLAEMRVGAAYARWPLTRLRPGSSPWRHPMPTLIDRLLNEHATLERLARLLNGEMSLRADPRAPDIALLVDALYYLTRFPDVTHHMLEDRIVERLLEKRALPASVGHDLEAQHATLIRQGRELLQDLESAVREENMSQELVEIHIRHYAQRLRHNMAVEESVLFPVAVRHLDQDDFRALALPDVHGQPDPLYQTPVDERFEQLHRVIAGEAGCGCDDVGH
ncbi:carboxymuconolactone decarboxylase family protein [Paraburkholderia fungorum]|jgi:AhpD family alkylhydroperoxidase|uniref:Carboxymuconolactone decarboxylase family protein n=2 Tax=Paraburkholderia fungorum TaxID=134537 RepID=A0AAP5QJB0_9BURK|nr:carboxymuconolactone decarboxylase family protein [Paraburkholderia fungorum]MDT8843304.1 carboxymuconolactone decarboxylase family protein [Paraburkholderia fungorum]